MPTIEANHYRETRAKLVADPIIQDMAGGVRSYPLDKLTHGEPDFTPRHEFMGAALAEYKDRGGIIDSHIGGPAEAIIMILRGQA